MSIYDEDDGLDNVSYDAIPVDTHQPEPAWDLETDGIALYDGPGEYIDPNIVSKMQAWEEGKSTYQCSCGAVVSIAHYQQHTNTHNQPKGRIINFFRKK
jgi:hypothetical protein